MSKEATFTPRARTDLIVVHCSATRPDADIGVAELTQWHKQRGFDTIGYHHVIRRDGSVHTGRPEHVVGAHVKGYNANSVGICLVGGIDRQGKAQNNFTLAQYDALLELLPQLQARYPQARIVGHRDLSPDRNGDGKISPDEFIKQCPSFDVRQWYESTGRKASPDSAD